MQKNISLIVLIGLLSFAHIHAQDTTDAEGQSMSELPASITSLPEVKTYQQNCVRIHEMALKAVEKRVTALHAKAKKENNYMFIEMLVKQTDSIIDELNQGNTNIVTPAATDTHSFMHGKTWKSPRSSATYTVQDNVYYISGGKAGTLLSASDSIVDISHNVGRKLYVWCDADVCMQVQTSRIGYHYSPNIYFAETGSSEQKTKGSPSSQTPDLRAELLKAYNTTLAKEKTKLDAAFCAFLDKQMKKLGDAGKIEDAAAIQRYLLTTPYAAENKAATPAATSPSPKALRGRFIEVAPYNCAWSFQGNKAICYIPNPKTPKAIESGKIKRTCSLTRTSADRRVLVFTDTKDKTEILFFFLDDKVYFAWCDKGFNRKSTCVSGCGALSKLP